MFKKKLEKITNAAPVQIMKIPPDTTLDDCQLAFDKSYKYYGTQHNSWINETIPRLSVLAKMRNGDHVDFRPVPWKNGTMFLCIDRKTGLDFGVLINEVARKLQRDYYGCYMVATMEDVQDDVLHVEVWQPPENL